jgi:Icc protein
MAQTSTRRVLYQITDTHIVAEGLYKDSVDTFATLKAVARQIEDSSSPCDAIVLTGDLADAGDESAYRRLRGVIEPLAQSLGVPAVYVPGNHDDRSQFRNILMTGRSKRSLDQVVWLGGLRLVALDTTVAGAGHGELSPAQLDFLDTVLATEAPEGTVVALHHPPLRSPVKTIDVLGLRRAEALEAALRGRDVLIVMAGHAHHTAAGLLGDVPVWVAGATAYQCDVMSTPDVFRGIAGAAYTRVDVIDRRATATQIGVAPGARPIYEHPFSRIPGAEYEGRMWEEAFLPEPRRSVASRPRELGPRELVASSAQR